MQIRKIALLLLLIISMTFNVFAAGPLEKESGSISVTMQHDGKVIAGGTLTAYYVAGVVWQEDHYAFVYTDDFADCELPLDTFNDEEIIYQFAEFALENEIQGETKLIDNDGVARFEELPLGLYLVMQNEAAEGYFQASPFLITVPVDNDGEWVYDVDASPKVEIYKEPSTTTPDQPDKPDQPDQPDKPSKPGIPQTGQLKWPIPVLSVSGLVLFILGWALCFRKKEDKR